MLRRRMRLLAIAMVIACTQSAEGPRRRIPLSPCRLKGSGLQAQCGTLRVPEDRAHPEKRQIDLKVAIVPALARSPQPDALFLLAGGPGQAATEAIGPILGAFERVRRTRDLVLVDQRGTGSSHPLRCDLNDAGAPLSKRLSAESVSVEKFRRCLAGYDADVRFYTTSIAMQDLDDVRAALGYEQIDLWGGSYGTRAALAYLRDHEAHVRAVVLDGVAPVELKLPVTFAADAQRSLDLLFASCAAEKSCDAAFPDLPKQFAALLEKLSKAPARVRAADPLTGAPADVEISRDAFAAGLRGVLYQQDFASLAPLIVAHAAAGDFAPFIAATAGLDAGFSRTMSFGMMFSVVCAEDLPGVTEQQIDDAAKGTFLGPFLAREFASVCAIWPREAQRREPTKSTKPVLLLSGEIDPATPPRWAETAKQTLPNSRHFVLPGVGHGATAEGCVPLLISQFIDAASVAALDGACLKPLRRPPFFVSFAGPPP
jgi:pimeloyl-ACP methyl ester carboxylesterase